MATSESIPTAQTPQTRKQRPPGPRAAWLGYPLLRTMRKDYLGFVAALHRDYGDISYMRLVYEQAYDLHTPELVREALVDHAPQLVRWARGIDVLRQTMGDSVLVTEGAVWQRQRRMLQPAFTPKRVAAYAGLMGDAAANALDAALPAGQTQALVNMDDCLTQLTMDVILRTLFGCPPTPQETRDVAAAIRTLSEIGMREMFWPLTLPDWLPLPGKAAKRQALRTLRGLIARHIQQRKAQAQPEAGDDLLARLLALRDEPSGEPLSDAEVFDQCMVTFQAGHETSATALLWWSLLMAEHPAVAQRIRDELKQVLGTRVPEPQDLAALPWLDASLKEALRLYPPVPALMARRTTQDMQLGGWRVPRGAMLRITPWLLHRDAKTYPEPEAFKPERFLPGAPPLPRGAWLPFGTGPRVCIGQHFAMLEIGLVAAMLLQRYTIERPDGATPCEPVMNVTLRPREPLYLRLRRLG